MKRNIISKNDLRQVRHERVRATVIGTAACPRLSVYRGLRSTIAQLVDDAAGRTLAYVNSNEIKNAAVDGKSAKVAVAFMVGKKIAEKAVALGIKTVVFDRGGYQYHGRVEAVADGARDGGLSL